MRKPLLSELTLREKIGQTAMGRPCNKEYLDPEHYPYGHIWALGNIEMGVINMADKAGDKKESLKTWLDFVENFSSRLKVPLLQGMDCTQGIENSFYETEPFLDPVTIGAAGGPELAYEAGQLKARLLKCVGSKWLWCPEVDLAGRKGAVHLGRLYSDEKEKLTAMALADCQGIRSQRVGDCAKHFPSDGSGLEYRDSHVIQTVSFSTMEQWRQGQGAIFKALIDDGVNAVMTTHRSFPACDPTMLNGKYLPSTTSYRVVTELLKGELGFGGVVLSDGVSMRGLVNMYGSLERVYVECIKAGIDVVLGVFDGYFDVIEDAVKRGEIPESRIDDACQRVLDLKEKLGLFEEDCKYASDELEQVNADIRAFREKVAKKAVSLVCNRDGFLPVKQEAIKNVAIIYSGHDKEGDGKAFDKLQGLVRAFEKRGAKVYLQRRLSSYEEMRRIADENDLIIHAGYLMRNIPEGFSSFYGEEMLTFHYILDSGAEKTVGLGLGSPYMYFDFFHSFRNFINAYNASPEMMEAVVAAIYGEIPFEGGHPFKLIPAEMQKAMDEIGMVL